MMLTFSKVFVTFSAGQGLVKKGRDNLAQTLNLQGNSNEEMQKFLEEGLVLRTCVWPVTLNVSIVFRVIMM